MYWNASLEKECHFEGDARNTYKYHIDHNVPAIQSMPTMPIYRVFYSIGISVSLVINVIHAFRMPTKYIFVTYHTAK